MAEKKEYIYGTHALSEALLHAPRAVGKVFLAENGRDDDLLALLARRGIEPRVLGAGMAKDAAGERGSHQGVVAEFFPHKLLVPLRDFLEGLAVSADTTLVLLDSLTDPHNLGAIIRSAAAFGAAGVLVPERGGAPLSGAVVKVSAGMAFRVPLVSFDNSASAVQAIQQKGFRIYALDMDGTVSLSCEPFPAPTLFIIGNEGRGVSQELLDRCDVLLSIPMDTRCESLNAAVSASIALYQRSVA